MERKLAAIMVSDYVGSTPAMESDEEASIALIGSCLQVIDDAVTGHGGRVFNTAGDALLAEFPSAVNALKAAMAARGTLSSVDGLDPKCVRFGLHLADVVAIDGDLRGDGVNLASRIQSAAKPGEIEVSGSIVDNVKRNSPCFFDTIGDQRFKGVSDPIRVFRVRSAIDRSRYQNAPTKHPENRQIRPNSLIVMPFKTASSADEDQQFLAEGLTDDLTLELSRLRSLFVMSRTAAGSIATNDAVETGQAVGAQFVLSGSVRKMGDRVRVNVSLTRTEDGEIVWSDRMQRQFDDIFDLLDDLVMRVAGTVAGRVEHAAMQAARIKRPTNMSAYEYYLRGVEQHRMAGITDEHVHAAIEWFDRAIAADANFSRPYAMQVCSESFLPSFDINAAEQKLLHALELDSSDPEVHRIMGIVMIKQRGDYKASRHHHQRALELAPNDAYVMGRCAAFYTFVGETEAALSLLQQAEEIDPYLPVWVSEEQVAALYALDRFDELDDCVSKLPFQTRRTRIYQAAAHVARSQIDSGRQQIAAALSDDPALNTDYIRYQELYEDKTVLELLVSRAHEAGLPHPSS